MCVSFIRRYDKGLIKKNLLAFERVDFVLPPNLVGVLLVPIKPEMPGEVGSAHDVSILWTYTRVKVLRAPPRCPSICARQRKAMLGSIIKDLIWSARSLQLRIALSANVNSSA